MVLVTSGIASEGVSWVPHSLQNLESEVLLESHLGHLVGILLPRVCGDRIPIYRRRCQSDLDSDASMCFEKGLDI